MEKDQPATEKDQPATDDVKGSCQYGCGYSVGSPCL